MRVYNILVGKPKAKRVVKGIVVRGSIILKLLLKKYVLCVDWIHLTQKKILWRRSLKEDNECLDCMKDDTFFDELSYYKVLS